MTLDDRLAKTFINIDAAPASMSWQDIIPVIDLTLLDERATPESIHALANKAYKYNVAALCVLPNHLAAISPNIVVKRATVANFPTGAQPHQHVLDAIKNIATTLHVDEIDYVFPYELYLAGQQNMALYQCHDAYQLCKDHGLVFKVILETGALPSNKIIYDISTSILNNGCDFLKTSTGKIATGATIPAVFSMLAAIVDTGVTCGIKVSGGIKTTDQALSYMQLASHMLRSKLNSSCFRIGASSLLDDLIKKLDA